MNRCPYCFKPLPTNGICDCHYEESPFFSSLEVLRPGSVVGACYQIGRVLGQGGFGITYQGYDLDLEKVVAIKEFYPKGLVVRSGAAGSAQNRYNASSSMVVALNTDSNSIYEKSLNAFFKEAKALARMSDIPNVVQVHRIFRENGTAYIVMDFVEGKSLKQMMRERGPIPEKILLPMLDPVVESMGMVHDLGILHRDIAPDNIVINKHRQAILLDFGASKLDSFQDAPSNQNSLIVQKKGFSPVEQLNGRAEKRSDIYAMGATYYTLLTGTVPQDAVDRLMNDNVRPLRELGFSKRVSGAVQKAMEVRKENRWDSMYAFRDALNGIPAKQAVNRDSGWEDWEESPPREPVRRSSQVVLRTDAEDGWMEPDLPVPEPKKQKSKKGAVWAVILAVLLAAAAAAYFFVLPNWEGNPFSSLMNKDVSVTATTGADVVYPPVSIVSTKTTRPTATKTPVPTKTTRPTATKTPVPTRTTRPTATKTPVPTRTTRPTATKTPVPTKTTRPTATKTPVPTRTTRPTATKTPVIVKTLPTAAEPILFGSKSLAVGDLVLFGRYEQDNDFRNLTEPIEWWVLAVEDGKALLLSRYALDVVPFNDSYDGVSWDTSSIRIWLRQVFFWKAFSRDEKDSILTVVNTTEPNPQDNNSVGGPDTEDKIFLLSYQEVQKYLGTDKSRECEPTDYTVARGGQFDENGGVRKTVWWLRTPGSGLIRVKQSEKYANERMSCIGSDGSFMSSGVVVTDKETAVRPAIWVSTGEN